MQDELVPVVAVSSLGGRFRQLEAGSKGYCNRIVQPMWQVARAK